MQKGGIMKYSGEKLKTTKETLQQDVKTEAHNRILTYIGYLYKSNISRHKHKVFERGVRLTSREVAAACNIRQATIVDKFNELQEMGLLELSYVGGKPQNGTIAKLKNINFVLENGVEEPLFEKYRDPKGYYLKIYLTYD